MQVGKTSCPSLKNKVLHNNADIGGGEGGSGEQNRASDILKIKLHRLYQH